MPVKKKLKPHDEFYIDMDEPVYTSGVVERLLDIPVWVLKQLDKEGIVSPARRKKSSFRLYSKRELDYLAHCWEYISEKGVKVKGLKIILEMEERLDEE
jgi:DNA-binding transcriptional MerR regulator